MARAPRPPKEQRSFADKGARPEADAVSDDRRDLATEIQTGQPGDSDVNLDQRGRFGNLHQNMTAHWKVQNR